jgi:MYXO-CTERM domain-containing protein
MRAVAERDQRAKQKHRREKNSLGHPGHHIRSTLIVKGRLNVARFLRIIHSMKSKRILFALSFSLCASFASFAHALPGGYEAEPQVMSPCMPMCNPTHGTCNADCTITCDSGFYNCNGNITDGCECGGAVGDCSASMCNGAMCATKPANEGNTCSKDCVTNGMCHSGQCTGGAALDQTYCVSPPAGCQTAGWCMSGECVCSGHGAPADLSTVPDLSDNGNGGNGHSGCGVSTSAAAPSGLALLLVAALMLLLVRRRSR